MTNISFSTAVNAALVAKPEILGILPSISAILALQSVFNKTTSIRYFFVSVVNFLF